MATRITSLNSYRSGCSFGSGEGVAQSLDNNTGTKLCNTNFSSIKPFWMVIDAGAIYYPSTYYYIYSANDADSRDPKNWLLQGSLNNSTWTTIDTVVNNPKWSSRKQQRSFTNDNYSNPYRYYRWYCQETNGDSIMQISELQIFREGLARYITVSPGANGTISPGSGYVPTGVAKTYTITPNSNYKITNITWAGSSQTITNELGMTFSPTPTADTTLSATFAFLGATNNYLSLPRRTRYPGLVTEVA